MGRGIQVAHLFTLYVLERTHAFEHLIEVHLMTVKLRTIHADKLGLSTHRNAAGTTHTCTIYHDGVERNVGGHIVFLGEQTAEFHHDGRADGETFVHRLALDDLLDAFGNQTFRAV